MLVKLIEQLQSDPHPAFACYATGDQTETEAYFAPVLHSVNPPAKHSLLTRVPSVPGAEAARDLFAAYNGLALYTDARTPSNKRVEIFPIDEWIKRTAQMVESWVEDKYPDDDMPYGHDDFIAFGHSTGASSYLHWVIRGPQSGSVYWWPWTMRPEKDTPPTAENFGAFIQLLYDKPAHFFNQILLGYTRFRDGRTRTEWVPKRYVADQNNPSLTR